MGRQKGKRLKSLHLAKQKGERTLVDFPRWTENLPLREGFSRGEDVRSTVEVWLSSHGGYMVMHDGALLPEKVIYQKLDDSAMPYVRMGEYGYYLGEIERVGIGKCSLIRFGFCWAAYAHEEYSKP